MPSIPRQTFPPTLAPADEQRIIALHRELYGGDTDLTWMHTFRNLMKAHNVVAALMEKRMARFGLSLAKSRLLFWLAMRDQEGVLPSELSRFQGIQPNTVTTLVASLREAGLIEQVAHGQDRRKRVIKITQTGRDLIRKFGPGHHDVVEALLGDLSPEAVAEFNQTLTNITNRAQALLTEQSDVNLPADPHCTQPNRTDS